MLIAHTCSALFTCSTQFETSRDGLALGATGPSRNGPGLSTLRRSTSSFQSAAQRVSGEWHEFVLRFMAGLSGGTQPLPLQQDQRHGRNKSICGDIDVGRRGDDNEDNAVQNNMITEGSGLMATGILDTTRKGSRKGFLPPIGLEQPEEGGTAEMSAEALGVGDGDVEGRGDDENKTFVKVNMEPENSGLMAKRNKKLGGDFCKGSKKMLAFIGLQPPEGEAAVAVGAEVPGVDDGDAGGRHEGEKESLMQVSMKPEDSGLMAKRNQYLGGNFRKGSKRVLPSMGLPSPEGEAAVAVGATVLGVGTAMSEDTATTKNK